ncbi:MAG TPA: exopolysaccharide Pel transporter PelG, partial [Planctomycetota bacterium]|nr:exopolysaccharide Pel transporter PelG [Planctomycetota bacterium]
MSSRVQGMLYSSPVAAGPWLFTTVALAFAALHAQPGWTEPDRALFRAILIYAHVAALVLTGVVRLVAGRYVALRLGAADAEPVAP